MNILIVYSNHHQGNFNEELLLHLQQDSAFSGNELVVRDLYAMDFDPVLRSKDLARFSAGQIPDDIGQEQEYIRWADLVLFVFPVWWGGMPAIMKGYIDKVFAWGFAYGSENGRIMPLLTGKKAMIVSTQGQSQEDYEQGMFQAMTTLYRQGIFDFCGIEMLDPVFVASVHSLSQAQKQDYFQAVTQRLGLVVSGKVHSN